MALREHTQAPELSIVDTDPAAFIPRQREEEYCSTHGLELQRHDNGAVLLTGALTRQDAASAEVDWYFPTGSHMDPPGRSGTLHMLEHLVSNGPGFMAHDYDVHFNAGTSPRHLEYEISGLANPDVRAIGIWPVMDRLFATLHHPERIGDNIQELIDTEKGNVQSEISQRFANHGFLADRYVQQVALHPDNPLLQRAFGTPRDVEMISESDIITAANDSLIPRGMVVTALTHEHLIPVSGALHRTLQEYIGSFPRAERSPKPVNEGLFDATNPSFLPDGVYTLDTGLTDGNITISYVWLVGSSPYTTQNYALETTVGFMKAQLHSATRLNGLTYSSYASSITPGERTVICSAQITIQKQPNIEKVAAQKRDLILPYLFEQITPQYVQSYLDRQRLRRDAMPMSARGRFSLAKSGLQQYGSMINFDELYRRHADATIDDFLPWAEYFSSVPPAIVIAGDLS